MYKVVVVEAESTIMWPMWVKFILELGRRLSRARCKAYKSFIRSLQHKATNNGYICRVACGVVRSHVRVSHQNLKIVSMVHPDQS